MQGQNSYLGSLPPERRADYFPSNLIKERKIFREGGKGKNILGILKLLSLTHVAHSLARCRKYLEAMKATNGK